MRGIVLRALKGWNSENKRKSRVRDANKRKQEEAEIEKKIEVKYRYRYFVVVLQRNTKILTTRIRSHRFFFFAESFPKFAETTKIARIRETNALDKRRHCEILNTMNGHEGVRPSEWKARRDKFRLRIRASTQVDGYNVHVGTLSYALIDTVKDMGRGPRVGDESNIHRLYVKSFGSHVKRNRRWTNRVRNYSGLSVDDDITRDKQKTSSYIDLWPAREQRRIISSHSYAKKFLRRRRNPTGSCVRPHAKYDKIKRAAR